MKNIKSESVFIQNGLEELHVKRFWSEKSSKPALFIHGSIENGKIFYSEKGHGLAPFLASNGYDVFVPDLRGRGKSSPAIDGNTTHGLKEIIEEDFDLYVQYIQKIHPKSDIHWVSHSWGGVLILAYMALKNTSAGFGKLVFFGTKRRITAFNLNKIYMINFGWNFFAKILIALKGYLPAKQFGLGADNESRGSFNETNIWLKQKSWHYFDGSFLVSHRLKALKKKTVLSLTGQDDTVLGHVQDVQNLLNEAGLEERVKVFGKRHGYTVNYNHINLLTHKLAPKEVFSEVLQFLEE